MRNKFSNISHLLLYKSVLLIWAQYIFLDNFTKLGNLDISLFHNRGIFRLIQLENFFSSNIPINFLLFFKALVICLLILNFLRNNKSFLLFFIFLIYFYELIKKGFGGHIDHRIITLYIFTLLFYFSVEADFGNIKEAIKLSYLFFFLQYFLVGIARIFSGFPEVFFGETFTNWIIHRNLRPSYFNLDIGLKVLEHVPLDYLNIAFLISTIVEVSAIACVFVKNKYSKIISIFLIIFHLGIFLFMYVNFIENILLLLLFIYILEKEGLNEKIYSLH